MSTTTNESVRTAVEDALWAVIGTNPAPASDLAVAAGISQSKTRKLLNQWATDGTVTRHTDDTNPRSAALWALPSEPHDSSETDSSASRQPPEPDSASETGDTDPNTATEPAPPAPTVETETETDADTGARAEAVVGQELPPEQTDDDQASEVSKLAPGALRGLVEDHLRDHAGQEFSPHQIGKALGGRSSGAVYNALLRLVGTGVAQMTTERPKKFMRAQPEQS